MAGFTCPGVDPPGGPILPAGGFAGPEAVGWVVAGALPGGAIGTFKGGVVVGEGGFALAASCIAFSFAASAFALSTASSCCCFSI